jgi:CubicO group peptidase (beta-lactamase class C family)
MQSSAGNPYQHYGYQFWLKGWSKEDPKKRRYPDAPVDLFSADGFGGQNIYIIPSRKLVIVRLGLHDLDENQLFRNVLAAFPNK